MYVRPSFLHFFFILSDCLRLTTRSTVGRIYVKFGVIGFYEKSVEKFLILTKIEYNVGHS